ncbi:MULTISPECIES: hypothetical protein [unclassified Streptomyces]|uniref:hypothetical protein n=1 Tax=unclassified Streptomyces TaxID=2593676 RepID=UPI00381B9C82
MRHPFLHPPRQRRRHPGGTGLDPYRRLPPAAGHGDAEVGLRAEYERYAAGPAPDHDLPAAAAVVAVHVPGGWFSFAWSGDDRTYLLLDDLGGPLWLLSEDHNERRACDGHGGGRNLITACLGGIRGDEVTEQRWGHPAIEHVGGPDWPG